MGVSKSSRQLSCIKVVAERGQGGRTPILQDPTICGKCAPLSYIGQEVTTLECFIERMTQGRLLAAYRPGTLNPAS